MKSANDWSSRPASTKFAPRTALELMKVVADAPADELGRYLVEVNGPAPRMWAAGSADAEIATGSIVVRLLVPTPAPDAVVVWFVDELGVLPGVDGFEAVARKLAERTGAAFILVPGLSSASDPAGAVDRARLVLRWSVEQVEELAGGEVPLVVGGAGTGGLLAALAAAPAANDSRFPVALQVLVCPAVPAPGAADTAEAADHADVLSSQVAGEFLVRWWQDDAARGAVEGWRALAEAPPTVLMTSGRDPLRGSGLALADRYRTLGGDLDHHDYHDELHDFLSLLTVTASETGFQQIVRGVRSIIVRGSL